MFEAGLGLGVVVDDGLDLTGCGVWPFCLMASFMIFSKLSTLCVGWIFVPSMKNVGVAISALVLLNSARSALIVLFTKSLE